MQVKSHPVQVKIKLVISKPSSCNPKSTMYTVCVLRGFNKVYQNQKENLFTVIKELALAWILCGKLHA